METNAVREANRLAPLQRSQAIAASNCENEDGRWDQLRQIGHGWVAENCAPVRSGTQNDYCNQNSRVVVDTAAALGEYTFDTLVNHDWCEPMNNGYRDTILNPEYITTGIGVAKGDNYSYVCQDFGG